MKSSFSPATGEWSVTWPGRVSKHDLVYLSPPEDPTQGIPIGNGDLGALIWMSEGRLVLAVNKSNVWDDNEPRTFRGWAPEDEERHTSLRHCARVEIDFGVPIFEPLYLQDFSARLSLADATAYIAAKTPFASLEIEAFASHADGILAVRCRVGHYEPVKTVVTLSRWGSRTFAHWYRQVKRDPSAGLQGTNVELEGPLILLTQAFRSLDMAAGLTMHCATQFERSTHGEQPVKEADGRGVGGLGFRVERLHSRSGQFVIEPKEYVDFTVYLAAATDEQVADPKETVRQTLGRAAEKGLEGIRGPHREAWRNFWVSSYIKIPDDYVENIWHLVLYFAQSSSRGEYPPHFCNGLWGWNRDFVPWNYYFHWNLQWYVWPLHGANHPELAMPYFKYRRAQLPRAVSFASEELGMPGAFYADVADRRGFNDGGLSENLTPGPQIAMDFWRHYCYTRDRDFLMEMAWPVIEHVTLFYTARMSRHSDGRWHFDRSSAYEGSPAFNDTITDLAMARALLDAACEASRIVGGDPSDRERWKEIAAALAPFTLTNLERDEIDRTGLHPVHAAGVGKGEKVESEYVFAVGMRPEDGGIVRNRYAGRDELPYYGFPDPELAPVFPSGVVGLRHRNGEYFKVAVTQVRLHPPSVAGDKAKQGTMEGSGDLCMGWCPYPIVLARLGLAREWAQSLREVVSLWQFYPQGFGHYGPYRVFKPQVSDRWRTNTVIDSDAVGSDERSRSEFSFPTWPFRHFSNEAMPIVATALNEGLLQSYEGRIRVCPAVPNDWDVAFTLAAQGGFLVSAERQSNELRWVAIESRYGETCRLVVPWERVDIMHVYLVSAEGAWREVDATVRVLDDDEIVEFATQPGARYILVPAALDGADWIVESQIVEPNRGPKRLGDATLGMERTF